MTKSYEYEFLHPWLGTGKLKNSVMLIEIYQIFSLSFLFISFRFLQFFFLLYFFHNNFVVDIGLLKTQGLLTR